MNKKQLITFSFSILHITLGVTFWGTKESKDEEKYIDGKSEWDSNSSKYDWGFFKKKKKENTEEMNGSAVVAHTTKPPHPKDVLGDFPELPNDKALYKKPVPPSKESGNILPFGEMS